MKIGDTIRLKTLDELKEMYNWETWINGINLEDLHITHNMYHMFGQEWKINAVYGDEGGYDFSLVSESTGAWMFSEKWIENSIIDVDDLFEDIEL